MAKRVFIADNRTHVLSMLEERLSKIGFDVIATPIGKEIIRTLNVNNVPDLIVLEAGMAEVDMVKIVHDIKSEKRLRNAAVLIMKEKDVDEKPFREMGVEAFITRPCDMTEVLARINELVNPHAVQAVGEAKPGFGLAKIFMLLIVLICVLVMIFIVFVPLFTGGSQ